MRRLAIGLLYAVAGYVAGAVATYFAIQAFSGNTHDRELEAAMTGAFAGGPLVAVVAGVVGAIRAKPRPPRAA